MWPTHPSRHQIEMEIRRLMHIQADIDYRIFELEQLRSRILSDPIPSSYDRERIAQIDAEISRLNFHRKEIERRIAYLRDLLHKIW
ncbi:MAG: hypothetical protein QW523_02560 [Nitrososphaerota archaeon]